MATVSPTGLVTAVAGGLVIITATSEGKSGAAAVTVTAPPPLWPNEPIGLTTFADWGFDQDIPTDGDVAIPGSGGWHVIYNEPGLVTRVVHPDTPFGPSNVGQWNYPIGFEAGSAPGSVYRDLPPGVADVYAGFWWKPSDPWEDQPAGARSRLHVGRWRGQRRPDVPDHDARA
jgi:hypothetical protein